MPPWTLIPDFIDPELFAVVRDTVPWTTQMKARETASMGVPYNYAGASYPEVPFSPVIAALADRVARSFSFTPNNCLLNRYRTGRNSIGWHTDDVTILAPDTGIVILSLGGERTLKLRSGSEGSFLYIDLPLPPGSALHMTAAMQQTWKHAIKREADVTERISLTFRHLTHAPPPIDRPRWGHPSYETPSDVT